MKLLMAIVRDDYEADVTRALNDGGFSVTRVSSTGGFWRRGNTTLVIGVENDQIDQALKIIDREAGPEVEATDAPKSHPPHRVTIFVLNVSDSIHF